MYIFTCRTVTEEFARHFLLLEDNFNGKYLYRRTAASTEDRVLLH